MVFLTNVVLWQGRNTAEINWKSVLIKLNDKSDVISLRRNDADRQNATDSIWIPISAKEEVTCGYLKYTRQVKHFKC